MPDAPAVVAAAPTAKQARPKGVVTFKADNDGAVWKVDADTVRGARDQRQGWVIIDTTKDKTVSYREARYLYISPPLCIFLFSSSLEKWV